MSRKKIKVDAIDSGTVIDHLPPKKSMEVLKILNLLQMAKGNVLIPAMNLPSKKLGKKDIIKIENVFLTEKHLQILWFIAPRASVSIIKDGEVKSKIPISRPDKVTAILKCPNENCITNNNPQETEFIIYNPEQCLCKFCERLFSVKDLKIKYNSH